MATKAIFLVIVAVFVCGQAVDVKKEVEKYYNKIVGKHEVWVVNIR